MVADSVSGLQVTVLVPMPGTFLSILWSKPDTIFSTNTLALILDTVSEKCYNQKLISGDSGKID